MRKRRRSWGNSTLEFTLVGIPLLFVLISTFEMARGMWIYHTVAYAVKEGVRYAVVRGQNSPNQVSTGAICNFIVHQGPGLTAHQVSVTFTSLSGSLGPYTADSCGSTTWPPGGSNADNNPGQTITINASFPFQSTIILFWPGRKGGIHFPTMTFPASSSGTMQF